MMWKAIIIIGIGWAILNTIMLIGSWLIFLKWDYDADKKNKKNTRTE